MTYSEIPPNLLAVRAAIGNAGWMAIDDVDLPGPLYVRVRPEGDGGRLRIVELYLDASRNDRSAITSRDVSELPFVQIDAFINAFAEDVEHRIGLLGPDLSTLATYFSTEFGKIASSIEDRDWVVLNFVNQLDADKIAELNLPPFRRVRRSRRKLNIREQDDDFRLSTGPTEGLTDEFLADVARAYMAAVARRERPNKAISEQTGYALKTVQRWVYTARQRGIMPRGSKGRPG